jgi:hypothetical protein
MAGLQGVTSGNKLLPQGILEGYAKAKLNDSKIKAAVPNFVQIQHNIVDSFTNIIRFEIEIGGIYIAMFPRAGIKKPPGGRFLRPFLGLAQREEATMKSTAALTSASGAVEPPFGGMTPALPW